jgi:hypothetical protein
MSEAKPDRFDSSPDALRAYSRGPTVAQSGRSFFRITCPFCFAPSTAYAWSIRGSGKICENKTCGAKFDGWGNAYPRIRKPKAKKEAQS